MKKMILPVAVALSLAYSIAAVAGVKDVVEHVPDSALSGIKFISCEDKPATYRVSCGSNKKCSVTVTPKKVVCKGVKS